MCFSFFFKEPFLYSIVNTYNKGELSGHVCVCVKNGGNGFRVIQPHRQDLRGVNALVPKHTIS